MSCFVVVIIVCYLTNDQQADAAQSNQLQVQLLEQGKSNMELPVYSCAREESSDILSSLFKSAVSDKLFLVSREVEMSTKPAAVGSVGASKPTEHELAPKFDAREVVNDAFEAFAASFSDEFHGDSHHHDFIEDQRRKLGTPSSKVRLRSTGEIFDARSLGRSQKNTE